MSETKEVELSLKVMINKQKTKVLFAEINSDFADVLLSFLTLPLGTIIKLLKKNYGDKSPVLGSLTTLYDGLAHLDSAYFWTAGGKQMLLNPRNSFEAECNKLKLNIDDTQPAKYFRCADVDCKKKRSAIVSMYYNTTKCDCGKFMVKAMGTIESLSTITGILSDGGGVFTKNGMMFLMTDDLKMAPIVPGTIIQTLINLGVTIPDDGVELMTLTLGLDDIMDLLRGSLLSKAPLTDLILNRRMNDVTGDLIFHMVEKSPSNPKKMIVKAWVRESTRKILRLQADEDFVDFLFSLLVMPLGGVKFLLRSNTSLRSIDNLYRSIDNFIDDECFSIPGMKHKLMKPELPPKYLSKNPFFTMSEQMNPNIYFYETVTVSPDYTVEKGSWMRFKDPKGDHGSYVKRPGSFTVTDNLIVTIATRGDFMIVSKPGVKELELHIGLEEALNILKASLTSDSALSDGLSNQLLEKLGQQ